MRLLKRNCFNIDFLFTYSILHTTYAGQLRRSGYEGRKAMATRGWITSRRFVKRVFHKYCRETFEKKKIRKYSSINFVYT